MKSRLMNRMARVKYLGYVKPGKAAGKVKAIYNKASTEFGIPADPFLLHSVDERILEAYYTLGREVLAVQGEVSRKAKDTLATIVSHQNTCQYCVDAHAISVGAEGDTSLMKALAENNRMAISKHPMHAMINWFSGDNVPFEVSSRSFAEYLAIYFYFHYTNRMINVFVGESQIPDNRFKGLFYRIGSWFLSRYTSKRIRPGIYNDEEPDRSEFKWAGVVPVIQGRLSHMNQLLDSGIKGILNGTQTGTLRMFIRQWDGHTVPMGQWWMNDVLSAYKGRTRTLMRFALLMMVADFMITESDIHEVKKALDDTSVLILASWSAFQTAKQLSYLKNEQYRSQHAVLQPGLP